MTTIVLSPVEASDGVSCREGSSHPGKVAAPMSPMPAGQVPKTETMARNGDDQAHAGASASAKASQVPVTPSAMVIANHTQQTIEALPSGTITNNAAAEEGPGISVPAQLEQPMHVADLQAVAAVKAEQHEQQAQQLPPTSSALPLVVAPSPADSMATEGQGASDSAGAALEVDMQVTTRPQRKEQPAFIQTSALIPNSCGYCGTRNTSGCWRRGWEIGNGKFINLCNKCGLRHKAGKLHSVPQPTPAQSRRSTNPSPSRARSTANTAAAAHISSGGGYTPTAADHDALAAAAAAAAAGAGLPPSSASVLLKVMGQQLVAEQQQRVRAGLPPSAAVLLGSSSSTQDLVGAAIRAEQQAAYNGGAHDGLLPADAMLAAAAAGDGSSKPEALDMGLVSSLPAAAAAGSGLPDFAAVASSKTAAATNRLAGLPDGDVMLHAGSGSSRLSAALAAAAAELSAGGALDNNAVAGTSIAAQLGDLSPEMTAYLSTIMGSGDEPAPKRRRTKKPAIAGPNGSGGAGGKAKQQQQPLREDSLAAGAAADALLALNRSSASASPVQSPQGPVPAGTAAAAPTSLVEAAAAAAADQAAAVAERAAAAAVEAAAAQAGGWSPALEAFLGGQISGAKRARNAGTAAAGAGRGGNRAGDQAVRQTMSRQVSSPGPSIQLLRAASGRQPSITHPVISPRTWNTEQLHAWLHASNCGEAVRAFRDQDVDGPAMAGLLRVMGGGEAGRLYDLLGNDLGVQHVGLRLRLVESIMSAFGGH